MNDFLDNINADKAIFYDTDDGFAEIITYNGNEIPAVEAGGARRLIENPGVEGFELAFYVNESDVASPKSGDKVTARSTAYTVVGQPDYDAGEWLIRLSKAHSGYIKA